MKTKEQRFKVLLHPRDVRWLVGWIGMVSCRSNFLSSCFHFLMLGLQAFDSMPGFAYCSGYFCVKL